MFLFCSLNVKPYFRIIMLFVWISRQNCRKSNVEECIFDYMASHIECRFNKISLLQCYFLAILPAGKSKRETFMKIVCNKFSRMSLLYLLVLLKQAYRNTLMLIKKETSDEPRPCLASQPAQTLAQHCMDVETTFKP